METNPILGRRAIPRKERLQKSLTVILLASAVLGCAWVFGEGRIRSHPAYLGAFGVTALLALGTAAYLWFKKEELPRTKAEGQAIRDRIRDERQGQSWLGRIGFNVRRALSGLIVTVGYCTVASGLGVLGFQVYGFLRYGQWRSVSVFDLAAPRVAWLEDPQSWFGLYRIAREGLEFLPLSVALLLVGWLVAGFGSALRQRVRR